MKHLHGTIYSRYAIDGNDNPLWTWNSTVEMLTSFLGDPTQDAKDKKLAAEILQWSVDFQKAHPELQSPDFSGFEIELNADAMWNWPDRSLLKEVTDETGVTRKEVVHIENPFPLKLKAKPAEQIAPEIDPDEEI